MTCKTLLLALSLALPAGVAAAQQPAPPAPVPRAQPRPEDPVARKLYPPDLVMKHQAELRLDDRQRDAIIKEIQRSQGQIVGPQWKLHEATEQLGKLLDASPVDEAKVLAQADKVMGLEREVKRLHLTLLVRIRNVLTDAQRARLAELHRARPRALRGERMGDW